MQQLIRVCVSTLRNKVLHRKGMLALVATMFIVSGFFINLNVALAAFDGDGVITVNPSAVNPGSTGNNFTFHFINDSTDFNSGSILTLTIPSGWTNPQESNSSNAGYVTITNSTCLPDLNNGTGDISELSNIITIDINDCDAGDTFDLQYNNLISPVAGSYTFIAQTQNGGDGLTPIAISPVVVVADTIPPVIAPHGNEIVTANILGGATVSYVLPPATDNVDPVVIVTCLPPPGAVFPIGVTTVTCNAIDSSLNPAVPTSFTVTVNPGAVSASQSTLIWNIPGPISTDGGTATFTITAKDQYGNLIPNKAVVLTATGSNNSYDPLSVLTDGLGQAIVRLQSTRAEGKVVSVSIDGVTINQTQSVIFSAGAAHDGYISASTITPEANLTGTTVTLTISVTDGSGNPVPDNTPVALLASGGVLGGSGNTVGGIVTRTLTFMGKGSVTLSFSGLIAHNDVVINFIDTTKPVITISGDNPAEVEYREIYTDAGATALDNIDVDITGSIVTVNSVDPNTTNGAPDPVTKIVGVYTVTYDVLDASLNAAIQQVRTVNVLDRVAPVLTSLTSDATAGSLMKIGDIITFTLTPALAEPVATVAGSYNGQTLTWTAIGGGATYIATYTVIAGDPDQNPIPLQITGVIMTDEAGNASLPIDGSDVTNTIDANVPTVASVDSDGDVYNLSTVSPHLIKVVFNEDIFNTPTIAVSGSAQTVNDCGGDLDAKTFCFDYMIPAATDATIMTIQISGALDLAGNVMADNNTHTFVVDTVAPMVPFPTLPTWINTLNQTAVPIGGIGENNAIIHWQISDGVNFVSGGDQVGPAGAIDFTANVSTLNDGLITLSMTLVDAAGNQSFPVTTITAFKDTVKPVPTLATTAANPTNVSPIPVTVTFSEPVTGFDETDVVVGNGTIDVGSFTGSGTDYSFTITPIGDGPVTVDVAADQAIDAASNGNTAATQLAVTYDTTKPMVSAVVLKEGSIVSDSLVKAGDVLTVEVTFNEPMAITPASTIAISGANSLPPTVMNRVDATHYTYDFTVGAGDGIATITIADGTDLATNPLIIDSSATFYVDNTKPIITQHDAIVEVANATGGKNVVYTVIANDDHDGAKTASCIPDSGYFFPVSQTTQVTCNVTDWAGNSADAMLFNVTVNPDVITKVAVTAYPSNLTTDLPSIITVKGKDQFDNITTNQSGTAVIVGVDNSGVLGSSLLTLNSGTAETTLRKVVAGIVNVTVSSGSLIPSTVQVTFTEADIIPPTWISMSPVNGAINVAVSAPTFLVFSEVLDSATVNSDNIKLMKVGDPTQVPAVVSLVEGGKRVNIDRTGNLNYDPAEYYFLVSGVADKAGNVMTVVIDDTNSGFSTAENTADLMAPTVLAQSPLASTEDVALTIRPFVDFSESMKATTLITSNIELRKVSDDSVVPASISIENGGARAVINPTASLDLNTAYYIFVNSNVEDDSGNVMGADYTSGSFTTIADNTVLQVTGISTVKSFAQADGSWENGWKWTFNVTAPTTETSLKMKFADFVSGSNVIPATGNIRFYSTQSSNADSAVNAIIIDEAGVYSLGSMLLDDDLDLVNLGRQIQISVEVKVPVGSSGGSYTTSYGVQTN